MDILNVQGSFVSASVPASVDAGFWFMQLSGLFLSHSSSGVESPQDDDCYKKMVEPMTMAMIEKMIKRIC